MEKDSKNNKITTKKKGVVVSKKDEKTVVVAVEAFKTHSKYKKKYRSTKKYKAHVEDRNIQVGDEVEIMLVRPISKDKKYKIV